VAAQRGHRICGIPEAPHTPAAGHRGMWRDFHEHKIARLPYVDPSTAPSTHVRTHASPPAGVGRAVERRENGSTVARPGDAGSGRLSRGAQALWRRPPTPVAWAAGERRGARPNVPTRALRSRRGQRPHIDSSAPDMPERCAGGLPGGWWYMTAVDSIGRYGLFFTSGLHRSARWLLPKPPKLEATKRHPVGHPPIDPETPCMGLRGSVGG
jgi:hypothetical protein